MHSRCFFASWPIPKKFILLLGIISLTASAIMIVSGLSQREHQIREMQGKASLLVESLVAQQEQIIVATKEMLGTLGQMPDVKAGNVEACNKLFRDIRNRNPLYTVIMAASPNGDLFAASNPFEPGTINFSDRKYFREAAQTLHFSAGEFVIGRVNKAASLTYAYPVLDSGGKLNSVLIASYRLEAFSRFIEKLKLPKASIVTIADHRGVRLYRFPDDGAAPIGRRIPEFGFRWMTSDSKKGKFEGEGPDGVYRIYAFQKLRLRDDSAPYLYMIAGIPKEPILREANRKLINHLSVLGIAVLLVIYLTWALGNHFFMKPINQIVEATERFGRGELAARTGLQYTPDELGRLAKCLDDAASLLEKRDLERRQAEKALRESEERFRLTFDKAPVGAAIVGPDFRLQQVNEEFCRLTGYTQEELSRFAWMDITHPEDIDLDMKQVKLLEAGVIDHFAVEKRYIRKDGGIVWGKLSVRVIKNPDGTPLYYLPMVVDISEHKEAQAALRESEEKYRQIAENIREVFWMADADLSRMFYVSQGYERIWGRTCESLYADPGSWAESIHPEDRQRVKDAILPRNAAGHTLEYRIIRPDGTLRWVLDRGFPVRNASGEVYRVAGIAEDITERKRAEAERISLQAQLANALEMAHLGHWEYDVAGDLFTFNDQFYKIYGATAGQVGRYTMSSAEYASRFVHPDDIPVVREEIQKAIETTDPLFGRKLEHRTLNDDGTVGYISVRFFVVKDACGQTIKTYGVNQDITEHKRAQDEREKLEAQLFQAQKMESVGRLAGGVAHDFNNMLGVILGHTELALKEIDSTQSAYHDLQEILKAAHRSAGLVRQLLAFARKQTIRPRVLSINETVESMLKMVRRLIGEDIELQWKPGANIWPVEVDPIQIDQVLANLCVNARDAIAGVGKVVIETGNATLDDAYCSEHAGASPGDYVLLGLSDSGCGMDEATIGKIFEPFFTTKEVGRGTGLGLATVYGIVKQNNGFIDVCSEPGRGATFRIYLPRADMASAEKQPAGPQKKNLEGNETVLLVEDEESILALGKAILERCGYNVLATKNPVEALRMVQNHRGPVHLLITDVVMPAINGKDLNEKLKALKPGLKCIFMSGYTADVIAHHGVLDKGIDFLQKPFSVEALAEKVRKALDG